MASMRTYLVLGRVSNLPTVWTNVLAGTVLSMAVPGLSNGQLLTLLVAMSLFYLGGMYLNDAFDAEIDAAERSDRPIPTGKIGEGQVWALGFAMLALVLSSPSPHRRTLESIQAAQDAPHHLEFQTYFLPFRRLHIARNEEMRHIRNLVG